MSQNDSTPLHIAMYPWLAMSHITSFLRIGNKLAAKGHKISIFLPPKIQQKLVSQIRYPNLITFVTLNLPRVKGLPQEAETTNDISAESGPLLMNAIDSTNDISAESGPLRRPFLVALKPPKGYETIESALPEGFEGRTKGKGMVYGGWVQQNLILQHSSVGCFITHCGAASLSEAMVNKCQIVMIPLSGDQFINARMFNFELKVGVEVEKRDDGFFNRESVHKAITTVMAEESQVGREVRANHTKWRDFIMKDGTEEYFINSFIQELKQLLK